MNESHISCPKCGASLDSDSVFCKRCGTKLEIPSFCRKCGKALAPDMLLCPACGLPLYDRTEDPPDTPKPESRKAARAVLLSIIALSVVLLLAILWIYNRQSVFQKAIEDAGGKNHVGEWAVASGDGKSLRVDTNPADEPNFYDPDALSAIEKINSALGLPDSLLQKMNATRAVDGRLTERYGRIKVSWTYHPDRGLEIVYERK